MPPLTGVYFAGTGISTKDLDTVQAAVRGMGGDFLSNLGDRTLHYLIVGQRWSEKYNYCARSSTKTVFLTPECILNTHKAYIEGQSIDVTGHLLEHRLKVFEGLKITASSLSPSDERSISDLISENGGLFTRTLNRDCYLVVAEHCKGKRAKFAEQWGKDIVLPQWIHDSIKRGVALPVQGYLTKNKDEAATSAAPVDSIAPIAQDAFSVDSLPVPPNTEPQFDAFDFKSGPKKKITNQYTDLFKPRAVRTPPPTTTSIVHPIAQEPTEKQSGIFTGITFAMDGFDKREADILRKTILSHDGTFDTMPDYVIVNSATPVVSSYTSSLAGKVRVITEWAIERSLSKKIATLRDVWGSPVTQQNIPEFKSVKICLSGFKDIELVHLERLVRLLGAELKSSLTVDRDLLVASSRECQKFKYAKAWRIPVISQEWLWDCAQAGKLLDIASLHALDGLGARPAPRPVDVAEKTMPVEYNTSTESEIQNQNDGNESTNSYVEYGSDGEDDEQTPVGKDFIAKSVPRRRSKRIRR